MAHQRSGPEAERRMFERINGWTVFVALGPFGQLLANLVYILWRLFRPYRMGTQRQRSDG